MPFDAAILQSLETALAEGFGYHRELDAFVRQSGIPERVLERARQTALQRYTTRHSTAPSNGKAPKRYVAQDLIQELETLGIDGDRYTANLLTGFRRGLFPSASPGGIEAINHLKALTEIDRQEKRQEEEARQRSIRDKEEYILQQRALERVAVENRREELRQQFFELSSQQDRQRRGYLFERFLSEIFEHENLQPRGSFRTTGEQIDGSFIWRNSTHLLEAKWTVDQRNGSDFGAFMFKIEGKSADTRGLFISISGYTRPAVEALEKKGGLRFVCLDGAHLLRALDPGWSLAQVLTVVWRRADETGQPYFPIASFPTTAPPV